MAWYVYILECADGTLYTGSTNDFERRLKMHNAGKGAKYTKGRGPLIVQFKQRCKSQGAALRRERELKGWTRAQKLAFIGAKRISRR